LLLVLPPALGAGAIVLLRYGAYPRAFLYVLPLALLVAVRGGMECGDWAARRLVPTGRWQRLARAHLGVGIVGAIILLSAASLPPYYRYPKQDYMGALQFVNARKAVTDTVSAVGMAANVYRTYYAPGLDFPATRAELAALRGP